MGYFEISVRDSVGNGDLDLANLALEAAIDLDEVLIGKGSDLSSLQLLAQHLLKYFVRDNTCGHSKLTDYPTTAVLVNRAFSESKLTHDLATVVELEMEARKLFDSITNNKGNDFEFLTKMKTFCTALSNSAATARFSGCEHRSSHPFRK